jgi:hypothetical protein
LSCASTALPRCTVLPVADAEKVHVVATATRHRYRVVALQAFDHVVAGTGLKVIVAVGSNHGIVGRAARPVRQAHELSLLRSSHCG